MKRSRLLFQVYLNLWHSETRKGPFGPFLVSVLFSLEDELCGLDYKIHLFRSGIP